jgi:hypothetical protein
MKTNRRTEITVETHRLLVMRRRSGSVLARCAECAGAVEMVTPDEGAILANVSSRTIYRWVEAEKIHFTETPDGLLAICLNSLSWRKLVEAVGRTINST